MCVQLLLDRGANVMALDKVFLNLKINIIYSLCLQHRCTALHLAAAAGHALCATLLLQRGANVQAQDVVRTMSFDNRNCNSDLTWFGRMDGQHCTTVLLIIAQIALVFY